MKRPDVEAIRERLNTDYEFELNARDDIEQLLSYIEWLEASCRRVLINCEDEIGKAIPR